MKIFRYSLLLTTLILLSACMQNPTTWVNQNRLEIHNDVFTDSFRISELNDSTLRQVAQIYQRYNDGEMKVGLTSNNKKDITRIESVLKKYGVKNLSISSTKPERGMEEMAVISFPALVAQKPKDCGMIPGYDGNLQTPDTAQGEAPYGLGCTVETMLARQVNRPKDLLGKNGFETNADGARAEGVVSRRGYYDDKSFPPLSGESASGD